jgi:DNA-directed RNA polymerase specialized sigma24 family protein
MLKGYVRRLARDRDSAHDLMQETCLRVLGSETAPTDAIRFSVWCCGVARNVAAQQRRHHMRSDSELSLDDGPESADQRLSPERYVYFTEKLAQAAGNVDPECLELFVRHYVLDEKICDLANERAQSAASLRMRLMRMRVAMRGVQE